MSDWGNQQSRKPISNVGRISDSSYAKLKWNIQGLFSKIDDLKIELSKREEMVASVKPSERYKLQKWVEQLSDIRRKIETFRSVKLLEIERNVGCQFITPDMVVLGLVQPSIRNVFSEIEVYQKKHEDDISIDLDDLENFIHLPEAAEVLALLGDAVIDLAIIQIHWRPNISNVGELTNKRIKYASNERLALTCDRWDLYDYRIHHDPPAPNITKKTVNHVKGTIIEAIFGVLYIEGGLQQVISSVSVLK